MHEHDVQIVEATVVETPAPRQSAAQPEAVPDWAIDSLDAARMLINELRRNCQSMVQGRDSVIDLILVALLSDGHVLLEDHPGSGKTTLAKTLGDCILHDESNDEIMSFRRVQFTPDLLPSDITGTTVFEPETQSLQFQHGPVFANVLLADEINRTSPKVQAALLEAMGEKQVTIDNHTWQLDELFFVIATQNPLDLVGTYPLPRAQLDRFLFKIKMHDLPRDSELEVLSRWKAARQTPRTFRVAPATIAAARRLVMDQVLVNQSIHECLVDIAQAVRQDPRVAQGISTRSLVQAIPALQVRAVTQGRDFVSHEDIEALAGVLFAHRLALVPGVQDGTAVIHECAGPVMEQSVRRTLR